MKTKLIPCFALCLISLFLALGWMAVMAQPPAGKPADTPWAAWQALPPEIRAKVDPRLLAELRGEILPAHLGGGVSQPHVAPPAPQPLERTRFLVYLKPQANLETIAQQTFPNRAARRTAVFNALVETAQTTQAATKAVLEARLAAGDVTAYQPFYIFNGFAVEGNLATLIELAQRDDVDRIAANYPLVPLWTGEPAAPHAAAANDLGGLHPDNWNIDLVDAERVWDELGVTGEGAVVGGFDTGVDWTHPALQTRYRGYDPDASQHDYNWFEPDSNLYPDGNFGPSLSSEPYDCDGHGTHTMGTMVGDGGTVDTRIGMAPGARWIAVPGICEGTMPGGVGDDIGGMKAFQWFLCPTDLSGDLSTADCTKAPHVINNSWGSANPADDTFRPAIQALRAAGVAPVFAAGNPSAGPGSIGAPANAPEAITVGATDIDDQVASFSGRGPSFYEGEQKPEFTAPGVGVKSSTGSSYYERWSGTSMAAPHVAGLIALLVSADLQDGYRDLTVDEMERLMADTALDLGDPGPDNDYGYGRIDAYNAVRWALSTGDLQGTVRDAAFGSTVAGAAVSGQNLATGDVFSVTTAASGRYAISVPAGTYNLTVSAWGYNSAAFSNQPVFTGALSIADFALQPLPRAGLAGQVLSGTTPVAGAKIYVVAHPSTQAVSGADGSYALSLPPGQHQLAVEANGYRILRQTVTVGDGGSHHTFTLTPAPTILLVDADTWDGWFFGWPVHNYFEWALDEHNYRYDTWRIQYLDFFDTQPQPDGSLAYGIPSTHTLALYDLVIWAHTASSPDYIGAGQTLGDYLDGGGRLILSGQNIAEYGDYWGSNFYGNYLYAQLNSSDAAGEGDALSGQGFLNGLNLKITNASLYGYPNGAQYLSPDAVTPAGGAVFPILSYDNGAGAAALAVDPCPAAYRAVYYAVGYENIAPRADNHDPAIAGALDKSITWAMGSKPPYAASLTADSVSQVNEPGRTATYDLRVVNSGALPARFNLTVSGNTWPVYLGDRTTPLTQTAEISPCSLQDLTVAVDIPSQAQPGDQDTFILTAIPELAPSAAVSVELTAIAFPLWREEAPMPTARYRLGAAAFPGGSDYYALGGWDSGNWASDANERYNACTGQWDALPPLPESRANVAAAALNNKIYVVGGMDNGYTFQDTLFVYDPAAQTWTAAAPLPQPLAGAAAAAANGKLYVFGGDNGSGPTASTYEYDPAADTWTEKAPLPGGARYYAAAAELGGNLYVVGGWPNLNTVEVYDPAADAWQTAAPMRVGRQSPGVTAAADGYLYVSGGGNRWLGLDSAERYDPVTNSWQILPSSLNDGARAGSTSAFVAGRVFAVGGTYGDVSSANESLSIASAFCLSDKQVAQTTVQPGERLTYTIRLETDPSPIAGAAFYDPLPEGTTFAGFGANPLGAVYNSAARAVTWSGTLAGAAPAVTTTFGVEVQPNTWRFGQAITNTVIFSGNGASFTRTALSRLDMPDFSSSHKTVDKTRAIAGESLTYTLYIINASTISQAVSARDPLPAGAAYLPGSLDISTGTAYYNAADQSIIWEGILPAFSGYTNTGPTYEWGDSDGQGTVPGVMFNWIDISSSGAPVQFYEPDDSYTFPISLPFPFTFYGQDYTDLAVATNGTVYFEDDYLGYSNQPIPGGDYYYGPQRFIAHLWSDLYVWPGQVYYQVQGAAPNRRMVIEYYQVSGCCATPDSGTWEIILYEGSGAILFQYQDVDFGDKWLNNGASATVGIQGSRDEGLQYAYNTPALHDGLAILFLPPGATWTGQSNQAQVSFAVTTAPTLGINSRLTNTAIISSPTEVYTRSAATVINPVDLSASEKTVYPPTAALGEALTYTLLLRNTGLLPASNALLTDTLPAAVTYLPGSLACSSGSCLAQGDSITWTGRLEPEEVVTITLGAELAAPLPNLTPVTNTAILTNGYGTGVALAAAFLSLASDLGASFKDVTPTHAPAGQALTFTVYIYNASQAATPAQMADPMPPGLIYRPDSVVCGSGECGYADGQVWWNGVIRPRSIVPVRFQAEISTALAIGQAITNTALVTDANWGVSHPVSAAATVDRASDLWLAKTGPGVAQPGETLVYTISYGNAGPHPTNAPAQVIDTLPAGAVYVGSSPAGVYQAADHTVTWDVGLIDGGTSGFGTFGTLNPGLSGTLVLSVSIPAGTNALPWALTNTAQISLLPGDPNPANNAGVLYTIIGSEVNLLNSSKTVAPVQASQGQVVTYTVVLRNTGLVTAAAALTDALPAEVNYLGGVVWLPGGSLNLDPHYHPASGEIRWQGPVAPGADVTLQFQAEVVSPYRGLVANTARINDGVWLTFDRRAVFDLKSPLVRVYRVYLPLVLK